MSLDHAVAAKKAGAPRPFASLLDIAESAFVQAGSNLEDSVQGLQSLRKAFASLETALGPEADADLRSQVADVSDRSTNLRAGIARFGDTTRTLRDTMAEIRSEVRALNTVVSLFANISINARIQGNSLMPPRPQINSFIARLAGLSAEADTILADVNDAMSAALDSVLEIESAQSALSDELRQTTLPAIESFTAVARKISEEQAPLRDASVQIAAKMQAVSSEVATLITSLQMGDTLRQRLEQAHAALELAGDAPNENALAMRVSPALVEGAINDIMPYIDDALASLQALAERGQDISRSATSSAFGSGESRRLNSGSLAIEAFEQSLRASRAHFLAMQNGARKARAQIEIITGHDGSLQRIAQHLRMAGINAVIACARLGEEGRALRELAQWLRAMTDESDSTMLRLQRALAQSRQTIETVSQDMIARAEADLTAFMQAASDLAGSIGRTNAVLQTTSGQFDLVARDLASRLAYAMQAMHLVRTKAIESQTSIKTMLLLAGLFPPPQIQSEPAQAYLAALRRKYTMASERTLHDRLIAALSGGSDADPVPEPVGAPKAASDVDDLDDILF